MNATHTRVVNWILIALLALTLINSAFSAEREDSWLRDAVQNGSIQDVEAALKAGANPAFTYGPHKTSVLGSAVFTLCYEDDESKIKAHAAIVKLLVEAGALKGWSGDVLFAPVTQGNIPVLKYLIANGATVSSKIEGLSLAELAVKHSQDEAYEILVKEGAVPVPSSSVALLRFVDAAVRWDIDSMQIHLDAGADVNGMTSDGETPLTAAFSIPAFKDDQYKGIEWLLRKGADPNRGSKKSGGDLPLNLAVMTGSFTTKGKADERGKQRADIANRIIKLMLSKGAKVSAADAYGDTPLHVASRMNYLDAAKLLLKDGSKVMPRNRAGKTPLDLAESKEMIRLLKTNGAKE